jgi:hypothetical protein
MQKVFVIPKDVFQPNKNSKVGMGRISAMAINRFYTIQISQTL